MSTEYSPTVSPTLPVRALLIRPNVNLPDTCTSHIIYGLFTNPIAWITAIFSSRPFPKPNDGCKFCVDRDLIYYKGKMIRLAGNWGKGRITNIDHFQRDVVIARVEGRDIRTPDHIAYVAIPYDHISLSFVDEIRYRLTKHGEDVYRGDHIWIDRESRDTLMV
ncbi:hypothetical protein QCA50_004288 [Cerrena zonata]|uniref:Uncharacterized protein n=1 Tax=Cerrena zonata TaxID=2478898 RepID=A0AAW0GHA7_9APHY